MTIKLLTESQFEFLSLKGGCTGSYESTLVKMPHCWKSHVTAQMPVYLYASFVRYLADVHAPCKMLQHLTCSNTMSTLDEQNLLSDMQHAVRDIFADSETPLVTVVNDLNTPILDFRIFFNYLLINAFRATC